MLDRLQKVSVLTVHRGGVPYIVFDGAGRIPYFGYYGEAYEEARRQGIKDAVAVDYYDIEQLHHKADLLKTVAVPFNEGTPLVAPVEA